MRSENAKTNDSTPGSTWEYVAALDNFESEVATQHLSNEVSIRPLDQVRDTLARLEDLTDPLMQGACTDLQVLGMHFVLSASIPGQRFAPEEARTLFEEVVTCLRLIRSGSLKILRLAGWDRSSQEGYVIAPYGPPLSGPSYRLLATDVDDLSRLVAALTVVPAASRVRQALSFFDASYEYERETSLTLGLNVPDWPRERLCREDRIIRLWVVMECLFTDEEEQDTVADKVAHRAERLAGIPYTMTRKFGRLRSNLIHANTVPERLDVEVRNAEDIVRRALRKAVLQPGLLEIEKSLPRNISRRGHRSRI